MRKRLCAQRFNTSPQWKQLLQNLISDDAIASYAATSGVHLYPEQVSVLQNINRTEHP